MERQESMTSMRSPEKEYFKSKQAISVVIAFHIIGLAGLCIPATRAIFLLIVPFHLLVMLLVIVISHTGINSRFIFFGLLVYVLALGAEWIGVHEGWLFGNYHYGRTLGPKCWGVPLIVGVNWFLLSYAAGALMQRSRIKAIWLRIFCGAGMLVLLDCLIEPLAAGLDYWHWTNGTAPIKNYVCWFVVSAAMLLIFELLRFRKQNMVAPVFLVAEFIFFGILYVAQVNFLP
jgi:bisanhydrobacterioruberin hydratase